MFLYMFMYMYMFSLYCTLMCNTYWDWHWHWVFGYWLVGWVMGLCVWCDVCGLLWGRGWSVRVQAVEAVPRCCQERPLLMDAANCGPTNSSSPSSFYLLVLLNKPINMYLENDCVICSLVLRHACGEVSSATRQQSAPAIPKLGSHQLPYPPALFDKEA